MVFLNIGQIWFYRIIKLKAHIHLEIQINILATLQYTYFDIPSLPKFHIKLVTRCHWWCPQPSLGVSDRSDPKYSPQGLTASKIHFGPRNLKKIAKKSFQEGFRKKHSKMIKKWCRKYPNPSKMDPWAPKGRYFKFLGSFFDGSKNRWLSTQGVTAAPVYTWP